jgi:very-short-patch-repair endonuclease
MTDDPKRWLTPPGVAARLKSDRAVPTAKRLRKQMTPAEKALWAELRRVTPEQVHFRKQAPIGPFVVDFASHAAKLVIELDGGVHNAPDVASSDAERQAWIEGRGYRVLRVRNEDVLKDALTIAKYIAAEAAARMR